MIGINNEENKQSIDNVKNLKEMSTSGHILNLFKNVKRTKEDAYSLVRVLREQARVVKRQEEEKARIEALKNQAKRQKEIEEARNVPQQSFAELFAQSNGEISDNKEIVQELPKKEQELIKTTQQDDKKVNNSSTTSLKLNVSSKQPVKSQPDRFNNKQNYNQHGRFINTNNLNNSTPKPFNNFKNARENTQKQFVNRQNYNSTNRPYNNTWQRNKDGQVSSISAQNKSLMSIIPKKSNNLTSATTAFVTKERSFGNKKKTVERNDDERKINKKSLLRRGLIEEHNIEERMITRKLKKPKVEVTPVVSAPITNAIITTHNITVKLLSEKIGKPVTEIIKQLMVLGVMCTINSSIDFATAELVANELGVTLELKIEKTYEEKLKENALIDDGNNNERRAPIVTIVGHVDHGKTSLLDYIRKTHVTSAEAGGITQAIGAYSINWKGENITFIDTPGHEAFINMRKRGTEITDIAVLIVAGDDGVKPQTIEAIKHIKEAKAPMIVAVTKIDKQNVNLERIKQQLSEHDVLVEEWGGETILVPVSSVTGEGIDKLLETILLVAEMQELKCNRNRNAVGTIIEARLDKNRGPIANVIVQNGTLRVGDSIVSGFALGKVRALIDDNGKSILKAGPSTPVSILGFYSVPSAGDSIQVVDEKFSKNVIEERKIKMAQEMIENGPANSLDEFLATPMQEDKKKLNLIIKADNQGSAEALKQSLSTLENEEARVEVINTGVGNINENDIQLAKVSNAIIISFNTKVLSKISNFAKQNKVEIREYNIIYKTIEDIEKVLKTMLSPKYVETVCGHAQVRALFKISSIGTIAGCYVTDGKIIRNAMVKVLRAGEIVFEGKIATLKREKDDVKEVASGFECGIKIENYNDVLVDDVLECIVKEQVFD